MSWSGTILSLVPEHCIRSPARQAARMVKHEITITGDKSLIDDIIKQVCGLGPQEALTVIKRYTRRCKYSEKSTGFFDARKEIVLDVELSDGSCSARVQAGAELGPLQGFVASLIPDWNSLLD